MGRGQQRAGRCFLSTPGPGLRRSMWAEFYFLRIRKIDQDPHQPSPTLTGPLVFHNVRRIRQSTLLSGAGRSSATGVQGEEDLHRGASAYNCQPSPPPSIANASCIGRNQITSQEEVGLRAQDSCARLYTSRLCPICSMGDRAGELARKTLQAYEDQGQHHTCRPGEGLQDL